MLSNLISSTGLHPKPTHLSSPLPFPQRTPNSTLPSVLRSKGNLNQREGLGPSYHIPLPFIATPLLFVVFYAAV